MRLHRLLGIIMLLDSRGTINAGNLAKILETSERTIYRDIDILCEAGFPITSLSGPTGGYSFMDNYKVNSNILGSNDVFNLLLSSMGVSAEKNTETDKQLKNAIIKLENSVSEEHREEIINATKSFFVDSDPWYGKKADNKYLDLIKKSVINLKKIKIHYQKYDGQVSERTILPYGVVVKNSQWYVVAFCEFKKDFRIFKCSRIENVEPLNQSFIISNGFNLEEFWEKSKQNFEKKNDINYNLYSYPVKIKSNKEIINLLNGFNIISSINTSSNVVYTIEMLSFKTASNVLFPLSDRLEILEPIELREYIIAKANKILDILLAGIT